MTYVRKYAAANLFAGDCTNLLAIVKRAHTNTNLTTSLSLSTVAHSDADCPNYHNGGYFVQP